MPNVSDPYQQSKETVARLISDRQQLLRNETEDYLRNLILDYEPRRETYWNRNYTNLETFETSIATNRKRWRRVIGLFESDGTPLDAVLDPWYENNKLSAWWISIGLLGNIRARAMLVIPKESKYPVPLIIAQHGIGSSPEKIFGLDDPSNIYKSYGLHLAEEGFAVIAPMNITKSNPRSRQERLCKLLGKTLWGLEIYRTQRLLDYLETRSEIDTTRIAMYGISLGGAYTLFTTPLETRIKVAVICAWFNHRRNKMVVDDPRYSCFLSVDEEHIWIPGWLREFTDSDLASLICPRPLLIEQGKADGIAWWPMVMKEYNDTRAHYQKLGIEDRIQIDLHDGGHEIRMKKSLPFLKKWLKDEDLSSKK